jgi:hypothetical protein
MKPRWRTWTLATALPTLSLCALVSYVVASEIAYARLKNPDNITNISDFYSRFGTSGGARTIHVNGSEFVEISGPLPPAWSLALPSSRPAYVFNDAGRFVDWCSDPGDNPSWRQQWQTVANSELTDDEIRLRFGINE